MECCLCKNFYFCVCVETRGFVCFPPMFLDENPLLIRQRSHSRCDLGLAAEITGSWSAVYLAGVGLVLPEKVWQHGAAPCAHVKCKFAPASVTLASVGCQSLGQQKSKAKLTSQGQFLLLIQRYSFS